MGNVHRRCVREFECARLRTTERLHFVQCDLYDIPNGQLQRVAVQGTLQSIGRVCAKGATTAARRSVRWQVHKCTGQVHRTSAQESLYTTVTSVRENTLCVAHRRMNDSNGIAKMRVFATQAQVWHGRSARAEARPWRWTPAVRWEAHLLDGDSSIKGERKKAVNIMKKIFFFWKQPQGRWRYYTWVRRYTPSNGYSSL